MTSVEVLAAGREETTGDAVLQVRDLRVSYRDQDRQWREVVRGVAFDVRAGETTALLGESGSGKSTIADAVLRLLPANARIDTGSVGIAGTASTGLGERAFRRLRGDVVSYIPQDPVTAFNPVRTIGSQLIETLRLRRKGERDLPKAAAAALGRVHIPHPEHVLGLYPHQLSGGMLQRVAIAIALVQNPRLLVADEPTSALDVTIRNVVLDLLDEFRTEQGLSLLLITHDLATARSRADRINVLHDGRIVESGTAEAVGDSPTSAHGRSLRAASPLFSVNAFAKPPRKGAPPAEDVVVATDVTKRYHRGGADATVLDGVSFTLAKGTTHALIGESGAGKTTLARIALGLVPPSSGSVEVLGHEVGTVDQRRLWQRIQYVYQNPYSSLDPKFSVGRIIAEPLLRYRDLSKTERAERVSELLEQVGLSPDYAQRSPRALSGGQRQRVAIARALAIHPEVIILDEPTSALDTTVQAKILRLLNELQAELGLSYLFVSHDLAVVRQFADTVTVLRAGKVVESGVTAEVFAAPQAQYTRALIDSLTP